MSKKKPSRLGRALDRIKSIRLSAVPATEAGAPPVATTIEIERALFKTPENRYELYQWMIDMDPELAGAVDSKAALIAKTIKGFTLTVGKELDKKEEALLYLLKTEVEPLVLPWSYDIAYKIIKDGNAVYFLDSKKNVGVRQLVYLPTSALTCLESKRQIQLSKKIQKEKDKDNADESVFKTKMELKAFKWGIQIFTRGVYVLSEGLGFEQMFDAKDCVHFDLGRKEEVKDLRGRYTLNIWNKSQISSLKSDVLWKHAIKINDMIWRERNVPRQHHKIEVGDLFDPDKYVGESYEDRLTAATNALQKFLTDYKNAIIHREDQTYPRPDEGIVTTTRVTIDYVEPKVKFTAENKLLDQIDKSVYSVVIPESAVSGRGRTTYASELAVGGFTSIKAERMAEQIGFRFVDVAKKHINTKYGRNGYKYKYDTEEGKKEETFHFEDDDLVKISVKLRKILERHELVRDAAILKETKVFSRSEIRDALDYEPLTEEQKEELAEEEEGHKHTETTAEIVPTKRQIHPRRPITPPSMRDQQKT